ncbi:MAG: sensor histidine kinase [Chloroflexi bacterium]|nr:sensor histidine kinase [Chloroflexota bacterium]
MTSVRRRFDVGGLRVQVLLWTLLPLTILLLLFSYSGISSHEQSMRALAIEENGRLIRAYAALISAQVQRYANAEQIPPFAVPVGALALDTVFGAKDDDEDGAVSLYDAQGRLLFGDETTIPHHDSMMPAANGGGHHHMTAVSPDTGHDVLITRATIPETGWQLVLEDSWHMLTAPLLRFDQITPLILAVAVIVSLLVLFLGVRYVVRPLQELRLRAVRIGQGDYDATALPINGVTEIRDLRTALGDMASRVRDSRAALQDYVGMVTQVQEEERARLSRELHDETVQTLIALGHKAQMIQRSLKRGDPSSDALAADMRGMIEQAIAEVRRFSQALHPHYLAELGLSTALESLARDAGAEFTLPGSPPKLKPDQELAVYRIAQEALNNVQRHANARAVEIEFGAQNGHAVLRIADDGVGFTPPAELVTLTSSGHFGLMGMHERAALVGGHLKIDAMPGRGTVVELTIDTDPPGEPNATVPAAGAVGP